MASAAFESSKLNFDDIKSALITHFKNSGEFTDYNFEGSALNNLVDVLAYNTQKEAMIANFALNEAFLDTAELRTSVVSHTKPLNYLPRSRRAAQASVRINLQGSPTGEIVVPKYTKFSAAAENTTYTFYTLDEYVLNSGNSYTTDIIIYEGKKILKRFVVDSVESDYPIYVIPDTHVDTSTLSVQVKEGLNSTVAENYKIPTSISELIDTENNYFIYESANNYYEIFLGDGLIGVKPPEGSVIDVSYLKSSATEGNKLSVFTSSETLDNFQINVSTILASFGGAEKESIESIKFNAPKTFAAQDRLVIPSDYKSAIKSSSSYVESLNVWGGEDNDPPEYGSVFIAVKPFDRIKMNEIEEAILLRDVINPKKFGTIDINFVDPEFQYIEIKFNARYNGTKTPYTKSQMENRIKEKIEEYSDTRLNGFEALFRTSQLERYIDDFDDAIVSVNANIVMQRRLIPELNVKRRYDLSYSLPFATVASEDYILLSDSFQYLIDGVSYNCVLRNKSKTTDLEIIRTGSEGEIIVVDNAGYIDYANNKIVILPFEPSSVPDIDTGIKFSIKPADQNVIYPEKNLLIQIDIDKTAVNAIEEVDV